MSAAPATADGLGVQLRALKLPGFGRLGLPNNAGE